MSIRPLWPLTSSQCLGLPIWEMGMTQHLSPRAARVQGVPVPEAPSSVSGVWEVSWNFCPFFFF